MPLAVAVLPHLLCVETGQPQVSQPLDDSADDGRLAAAWRAGQEAVLQSTVHGHILWSRAALVRVGTAWAWVTTCRHEDRIMA